MAGTHIWKRKDLHNLVVSVTVKFVVKVTVKFPVKVNVRVTFRINANFTIIDTVKVDITCLYRVKGRVVGTLA